MELVLAEPDRDRRQLGDLAADGLAGGLAPRLREAVPALAALRPVVDRLVDRLDRCQPAPAPRMARLAPLRSPQATRPLALRRPRRILARRQRRVPRVAFQAALELGDPLVLLR